MAREIHKLTARKVETLGTVGRYADGGNLYLLVGLLCANLLGSYWLQPQLKRLHTARYHLRSTSLERLCALAMPRTSTR